MADKPNQTASSVVRSEQATPGVVRSEEATPGVVRSDRKTRTGLVVSDKMDKTVIVSISQTVRHPLYSKIYSRNARLSAHDETNDAHVGDKVVVSETRPLSKTKRWRVVEVVERAK